MSFGKHQKSWLIKKMLLMDTKIIWWWFDKEWVYGIIFTFLQYNTNQLSWGNDDCKGEELGRGQYY